MYEPWDKKLEDLDAADLEVLRGTFEGWYIEYKRSIPKPIDLAKALSAFANCDGGWLFLGIAQSDNNDNRAHSIGLLSTTERQRAEQLLEEATYQHIQPRVWFESRWVPNANTSSDKQAPMGVLVVRVDPSEQTPHVTIGVTPVSWTHLGFRHQS